jgi:hypothetical protein
MLEGGLEDEQSVQRPFQRLERLFLSVQSHASLSQALTAGAGAGAVSEVSK